MILEARNLARCYGQGDTAVWALRGLSFGVEAGEFVAIMGPSGSGKSTLMNLIGLLDRPTSGTLAIAGEETADLPTDELARVRNRKIGFVFQSYNLLQRDTAVENVELPLVYGGMHKRDRAQRAEAALVSVGLSHRLDHRPMQLSGGEQQRVAIARALVSDPAIILADEPTGALDSRTGLEILALFERLNEEGRTIVLVTHDEKIARRAARVIRVQDGALAPEPPALLRAADASVLESILAGLVRA